MAAPVGILASDAETTGLMRDHAWETTLLGDRQHWPACLRTAIALVTAAKSPMFLLWGPRRSFLYNDAYVPFLDERHPRALAQPFDEIWAEVWDSLSPLVARVYAGESVCVASMPFRAFTRPDAGLSLTNFAYSPLRNERGMVEGLFCVCIEAPGQDRAGTALWSNDARVRALAEMLPNHVWTAKADGQIEWLTDHIYEYSGAAKNSLDGNRWPTVVHPYDRIAAIAAWRRAVSGSTPYEAELRLRHRDGTHRWHISRATPFRGDNGTSTVERWVGTCTDIEVRKRSEKGLEQLLDRQGQELDISQAELRQAQKMEAIGQLTGGLAHDFNNMLSGITLALEMIQQKLDLGEPEQARRYAKIGIEEARRAAALTHRLLAFARRKPLELKEVDVNERVRSMDDLLRRTLGSKVQLCFVLGDDLWPVSCDPNQLEMALLNLAINAKDAMPAGGALKVTTANKITYAEAQPNTPANAAEYVCLTVADDGTGMSKEALQRVFEPFYTTKPEGKGSGLGLSMVYAFAKQSGGLVRIVSREGKGTDVRVYLPRLA